MSLNLIQQAKDLFSGDVVSEAGNQLGESPSAISTAISGIVPTLFSGLLNKSQSSSGADAIASLASGASNQGGGIMSNLAGMLGGSGGGSSIISSLFGGAGGGIASTIANFAGIKSGSATSLMGMAGTAVMGFIGKYMSSNNVGAGGLASLFSSQKEHIAAAMPAGLNLSSMLGGGTASVASAAASVHDKASTTARQYTSDVETSTGGGGMKWLLPVLLLALLGAGALYYFKGCKDKTTDGTVHSGTDTTHTTMPVAGADTSTGTVPTVAAGGTVDADGNYVYNVGDVKDITLPNGAGVLKVGQNSTEAKLVSFLQSTEAVDTAKGNWFDFTNVYFNSGKSTITETSMTQLNNMVMIAKAFPKAQFKIGGYTDNTGNEAANVKLSKDRAAIVAAKLKELGASNIVSSDGYGPKFPIGDNATAEGKAQNRRVSVNVKAK